MAATEIPTMAECSFAAYRLLVTHSCGECSLFVLLYTLKKLVRIACTQCLTYHLCFIHVTYGSQKENDKYYISES